PLRSPSRAASATARPAAASARSGRRLSTPRPPAARPRNTGPAPPPSRRSYSSRPARRTGRQTASWIRFWVGRDFIDFAFVPRRDDPCLRPLLLQPADHDGGVSVRDADPLGTGRGNRAQ